MKPQQTRVAIHSNMAAASFHRKFLAVQLDSSQLKCQRCRCEEKKEMLLHAFEVQRPSGISPSQTLSQEVALQRCG